MISLFLSEGAGSTYWGIDHDGGDLRLAVQDVYTMNDQLRR
jgi:hypothetical protein